MNYGSKRRWRVIRDYIIGWTLAFIFLSIVRGVGTVELGSVQFELKRNLLVSVIFGISFGMISGYAQVLTEEKIYKRISIQKLLLLRLVFAILFLALLVVVSYAMVSTFFGVEIGLVEFIFEPGSFAIYFYILFVDFFMAVLRQINLMMGERNLMRALMGKFYTPREEERIFMFLDLQSSTLLAEKLGHIKYSMLIQDCFNDLGVVVENAAEIYQYVGDEAILTWKLKQGLRSNNCIKAFYNFKEQLDQKKEYYVERYGTQPVFKAGIHSGIVTVTEVGKYKKEIAYHGDTINTAARIQARCNDLEQRLLISEQLKAYLETDHLEFINMGSIPLKGKEQEVVVHGVSEP